VPFDAQPNANGLSGEEHASLPSMSDRLLAVKFDVDTLQHVLYVKRTPDLSEFYSRVGIIFGDCINNLRNSLDYLVYEMECDTLEDLSAQKESSSQSLVKGQLGGNMRK
jgi:hypothetical protein